MVRPSRPLLITFAISSTAGVEATGFAQMSGEQAVAAASATQSNLPPDTLTGEGLFGRIGEDYFLTLALRLNFDREDWGFGVQLPLRFRVIDNDPKKMTDDYLGVLRREDWDEWRKFLRVIRYVYVGQADKKGPFYVRVGELQGLTVGHGTIMYRYFNGIDLDRWHTGVNAAVNVGAFGGEAMIGDVTDPYLGGLRFTVRPLDLALGEGWPWDKLVVGTTLLADLHAPTRLATNTTTDMMGGVHQSIALDDKNHPIVTGDKTLAIYGLDVGIEVFSNELFSITPYVDLNKMSTVANGWGFHTGILWQARLPMLIDTLTLDARTEYRRVSGDYVGPYFNTTYEIERYTTLGAPAAGVPMGTPVLAVPKLATLTSTGAGAASLGGGRNGVFFDLLAGFPQFIFVGGEYIAYDGPRNDGSLRLSLEVPALKIVKFSAFYYRINVAGLSDLFKLDDRSAIVASASIPLYSVFSVNLKWWRVWRADPATGDYRSADDWSVGVGLSLQL
jgi:hypothetical protein